MSDRKIIVAYDGSPDSEKALKMAADLAKKISAEILAVSVYDIPCVLADGAYYSELEKDCDQAQSEKAQAAQKYCDELGVKAHAEVLQGNPADEIIQYAHQEKAYLIVAGTRGLGGFKQLLLGSVAHRLVTYSDIPVLVVK